MNECMSEQVNWYIIFPGIQWALWGQELTPPPPYKHSHVV